MKLSWTHKEAKPEMLITSKYAWLPPASLALLGRSMIGDFSQGLGTGCRYSGTQKKAQLHGQSNCWAVSLMCLWVILTASNMDCCSKFDFSTPQD